MEDAGTVGSGAAWPQHSSLSPDGSHQVILQMSGEVRFGPAYYNLRIDNVEIAERVFFEHLCWSADSRYVVAEEWPDPAERGSISTQLVVFDVLEERECTIAKATRGFIKTLAIADGTIRYCKDYPMRGTVEYEQDWPPVNEWLPIAGRRGS